MQEVSPEEILPSQNFLKEKTVRYIFDCIAKGRLSDLPPTPLVRKDEAGKLVAIDGHNLIAVRLFRNESVRLLSQTPLRMAYRLQQRQILNATENWQKSSIPC